MENTWKPTEAEDLYRLDIIALHASIEHALSLKWSHPFGFQGLLLNLGSLILSLNLDVVS